jgi:hypothetical protein
MLGYPSPPVSKPTVTLLKNYSWLHLGSPCEPSRPHPSYTKDRRLVIAAIVGFALKRLLSPSAQIYSTHPHEVHLLGTWGQ